MPVTLDCTSAPFVRCGKDKVLTVATLVARNTNDDYGGAYGGSLESDGRFCVGAFGRNLASVVVKMFSQLIYFIQTFYKFLLSI
jgi:hypothetical protein